VTHGGGYDGQSADEHAAAGAAGMPAYASNRPPPLPEADCFGRPSTPRMAGGAQYAAATPAPAAGINTNYGNDDYYSNDNDGYNNNSNNNNLNDTSAEDPYRPCKARVPPAEWANQAAGTANPNALMGERPEVRLGANRAPGACRPKADSLNFNDGTSVVGGAAWSAGPGAEGGEERVRGRVGTAAGKHHNPWAHSHESEGVLNYRHSGGLAPHEYKLQDHRGEDRVKYEVWALKPRPLSSNLQLTLSTLGVHQRDNLSGL